MEKFVKFERHEYMDMYPEAHVRTFIADDMEGIVNEAKKWADYMNSNYSGGTCRFEKVMTTEEAKAHVDSLVDYEKKHWQDDSQEFIDKITNLYNKCYETV